MLGVVLLLVATAWAAPRLGRWIARPPEDQALAGLFGEPEREQVIARRCAHLTEAAEQCVRVSAFATELGAAAWKGTPLQVRRCSAAWSQWIFADGRTCRVRHGRRAPRGLRRLIVRAAAPTAEGLRVSAYGAGAGHPPVVLDVHDVHDVRDVRS